MPRCRDLAIFVVTTTDRQTDYFTPAHARRVIMVTTLILVGCDVLVQYRLVNLVIIILYSGKFSKVQLIFMVFMDECQTTIIKPAKKLNCTQYIMGGGAYISKN